MKRPSPRKTPPAQRLTPEPEPGSPHQDRQAYQREQARPKVKRQRFWGDPK